MDTGDILIKWLIGAGIGTVFAIFIGIGNFLSAKEKIAIMNYPQKRRLMT